VKSLQLHIGLIKEHTTFEAEDIGTHLRLHLLPELDQAFYERRLITIYQDSQAIIMATAKFNIKSSQHIIEHIHKTAKSLDSARHDRAKFNSSGPQDMLESKVMKWLTKLLNQLQRANQVKPTSFPQSFINHYP
jgi:hypothetical protein